MAKIDLEKVLIALLDSPFNKQFDDKVKDALKEQGLEYKDGEIVEVQKSKFKAGDWVVDEHGYCFIINSIERGFYFTQLSGCCYQTPLDIDLVDNSYHAWTLEDAKDGDVLYYISDSGIEYIVMNKGINIYNNVDSYFRYNSIDGFAIDIPSVLSAENDSITPATNAERAILFQKMHEAGYEWDADKKELKKIDNRFDYEHANIQQKDYSPKEDEELFFGDFRKTDSEDKGKASFANRQLYNRAILKILSDYVEKYPDIRFGKMLCNLGISGVAENNFYVESSKTYQAINTILNEQKNEKNRII